MLNNERTIIITFYNTDIKCYVTKANKMNTKNNTRLIVTSLKYEDLGVMHLKIS